MSRLSYRILHHDFPRPPARVKIAGALVAAALTALALDAGIETPKPPAPAPVANRITSPSPAVRNMSYYPEQLAALTSLASFQPVADAGLPDASSDGAAKSPAAALAPSDVRPVRRADAGTKAAPPPALQATATTETAPQPQDRTVKLFGVALPGADLVAPLSSGIASLGGKVSGFWH